MTKLKLKMVLKTKIFIIYRGVCRQNIKFLKLINGENENENWSYKKALINSKIGVVKKLDKLSKM